MPAGAGSAPDIVARLVGDELRKRLAQPVIVENKPGAGGIIGAMAVKQAKPDGNTLLFAQAAVVTVTPLTYRAASYDMERDFETVSAVADTPMMIVANVDTGPKSLSDLVAQGKAKPESITFGSTARGSVPHLTAELIALVGGARFNTVAFGTSSQAVQAVVGGDTQASVDGVAPLLPLVKAGRVRPLAVTAARVLPGLEAFPLAKDTVPGLVATGWFMLFAPKGTPAVRVQAINSAVDAAVSSPEIAQKLQVTATYPIGGSVADARRFLEREKKLWAGAVERAGLQRE